MVKKFLKSLPGHQILSLAILLACLLSPLFLNGNLIPGMAVLLAYTCLLILPLFFHISMEKFLLILIFMIAFLDVPAARPYYDHESFTEILGGFLFDGIKKMTGIPIPFTLFELISYGFVLWILFKHGLKGTRAFQVMLMVACAVPAVAWLSALLGALRGNSLATAYTQIRFISLMSAWTLIGYFLAKSFRDVNHGMQLLFLGTLIKSLYALAVFTFILRGDLGKREYLIDHISSLFMATALFYAGAKVYFLRHNLLRLTPWLMAIGVIAVPYFINDRRASFFGMLLAVCLIPAIIPRRRLKQIFWPMILISPVFLVIYFLHILYSGGDKASLSGIVVHALTSKSNNIDYREIENFNLYFSIINNPILGLGYGRSFPVILPMPDISFVFKLYDLIPHNSALYLWAFAGPMGMAALGVAMAIPLIACVRLIKFSRRPDTALIAFVCFTLVIGWFCFVYFDMGILDSRAQALYGIFVGAVISLYQKTFDNEVARNVS